MRKGSWVRRPWAASAVVVVLWLCGCGGSSDVAITKLCDGDAGGLQIHGVVQMPNGRIARAASPWERVAGTLWSAAAAISASVSPVATGQLVELVELRPEDLANGTDPGPVEVGTTGPRGDYCMGLPAGTDQNVCRYVVQVGSRQDGTLTRAFVFGTSEPIDIDFRSEAAVRAILAQIPPAGLCDFSPDEIRNIYDAVVVAPGVATGSNADEVNSLAATLALADPGVDAALSAAVNRAPTPTRTEVIRRTETFTPRSTRTAPGATHTPAPPGATSTPTLPINTPTGIRLPTRTPTPG